MSRADSSDLRSDGALIAATPTDPGAFGVLYDRYERTLLGYFVSRTASAHVAADLTSETFAAALDGLARFDESRGSVGQWLFGIARHQLSHYLRHRQVEERARSRLGLERLELTDDAVEQIERLADFEPVRSEVWRAVTELPHGQAEAIRLRIALDLPYDTVAAHLGCTVNTARVRVARGLAALRTFASTQGGLS